MGKALGRTLLCLAAVPLAVGCGGGTGADGGPEPRESKGTGASPSQGGGGGGGAAAMCANGVSFDGRSYWEVGPGEVELGKKLGTARSLSCDDVNPTDGPDGGGPEPSGLPVFDVYEIAGLETGVAVAVGDARDDATLFAVPKGNKGFPPGGDGTAHSLLSPGPGPGPGGPTSRVAMSSAAFGGRTVDPVTEEDL